jgi:hypothetical protein
MDSEKDDSKMNSSASSFRESVVTNNSPSKSPNKYLNKVNIVPEEEAFDNKSESQGGAVGEEVEDQFSENESNYEVKVKMQEMDLEGNNTINSAENRPISFKVQVNKKKVSEKKLVKKLTDSINSDKSQIVNESLKEVNKKDRQEEEESNRDNSEEGEEEPEDEEMGEMDEENQIKPIRVPQIDQSYDNTLEWYDFLRKEHNSQNPWEDLDFPMEVNLFGKHGEYPERFKDKDYIIEFVRLEDESDENHFFSCEHSTNIDYQFNLKRGIMNDKFFIGSVLMLFRKKEQFLTNLVVDYENIVENLKAGFCGFTFFINGEWKTVTIDTNLPWYQSEEMALSIATSNKASFWLCLLEKAYAKAHKTYDVLNDVSVKNTLVDLTGGISKKISIKEKMDDSEKKGLFDEIKRCIAQKYLVGSMKFDLTLENVNIHLFIRN